LKSFLEKVELISKMLSITFIRKTKAP